jgi:hypothetical protein
VVGELVVHLVNQAKSYHQHIFFNTIQDIGSLNISKIEYRGGQNIAERFLPKKSGDIDTFGDIVTVGDMETEINFLFKKMKNA